MSQTRRCGAFFRKQNLPRYLQYTSATSHCLDLCYLAIPGRLEVVSCGHVAALCKNQGSGNEEEREMWIPKR